MSMMKSFDGTKNGGMKICFQSGQLHTIDEVFCHLKKRERIGISTKTSLVPYL